MPTPDLPTSVRLPPELKRWLIAYSKTNRRPLSYLIVWVLEQFRKHEDAKKN
jgi:predicted DNA-binding protein